MTSPKTYFSLFLLIVNLDGQHAEFSGALMLGDFARARKAYELTLSLMNA